jgi:signal transduction histidine kinase
MHPLSDASASRRARPWRVAATAGVAVLLCLVLGLSLWLAPSTNGAAHAADGSDAAGALALLFAVMALLVALLAAMLGAAIGRSRLAPALREARGEQEALRSVLDAWQWRTDAEHRLRELLPPRAAPAMHWVSPLPAGQHLWERFEFDAATIEAMPRLMSSRGRLDDIDAWQRGADGSSTRWSIRGAPLFDADGAFAGYLGTAREVRPRLEAPWLVPLLDALPGPAFVAQGRGGACHVAQLNAEARELIGGRDGGALGWDELARRLPAALGEAVQRLDRNVGAAGSASAEADGWHATLRRQSAGDERLDVLALVRMPGPQPACAPDSALSDHEAFSYTVSHDLRAPIRVVEGFTRIVKEDYGRVLDRIGIDHLDRVLGAAARMNSMIDALLELSQLSSQPLARQPVNLSQLAGYVVDDLRRSAPERSVEVVIQPQMVTQGDPTLLRVVLENLLGNAWKYTTRTARARIAFESQAQGDRVVYRVNDNGAGFDMRFADRLFGVFQRLHSAGEFQGTGVGLASVRRIVRRHGGDIWAEAEVDRGATFYFTLQAG